MDPLAFVSIYYDAKHEDLYVFDEIYQQKLRNSMAVERIHPLVGAARIIADSAEPKSIAEMRDLGLRITGREKAVTA